MSPGRGELAWLPLGCLRWFALGAELQIAPLRVTCSRLTANNQKLSHSSFRHQPSHQCVSNFIRVSISTRILVWPILLYLSPRGLSHSFPYFETVVARFRSRVLSTAVAPYPLILVY